MTQNDYQVALLLQQQFEHEATTESPINNLVYVQKKKKIQDNTKSLIDPSWELIDPTPDIHMLFIVFNEKYFWNKLLAVCVDWSKRMTTCAGICSYQGRGGMCRITLSEPLLKLRPRKDLVETLLHEMIHAFLFVTDNNKDRNGHGPEFHKHMYRINTDAGTNITVYHDFHDEVRLYKQHWWRCNGPCQTRHPFFGMVRRATNRAPSANDFWFAEHQRNCGGTFIKVKEPPKKTKTVNPDKKQPKKKGKENNPDSISKFFPTVNQKTPSDSFLNTITGFKDLSGNKPKNALKNSSSTIVINKKPSTITKPDSKDMETPKSKLIEPKQAPIVAFSGTGRTLSNPTSDSSPPDYNAVRNHWANKFTSPPLKRSSSSVSVNLESPKRLKADIEHVTCPVCQKLFISSELNAHLDHCLEEQSEPQTSNCPICDKQFPVNDINQHVETCLDDVFSGSEEPTDDNFKIPQDLIKCLVCSKEIPRDELSSHLDDCMGGNNIFNNSCDDVVEKEEVSENKKVEKFNCPVCFEMFDMKEMSGHLDKCFASDDETSVLILEDVDF